MVSYLIIDATIKSLKIYLLFKNQAPVFVHFFRYFFLDKKVTKKSWADEKFSNFFESQKLKMDFKSETRCAQTPSLKSIFACGTSLHFKKIGIYLMPVLVGCRLKVLFVINFHLRHQVIAQNHNEIPQSKKAIWIRNSFL
jgi:glucosamine 6-phosphate synthetase-like amidotransferase/phosphosugar isomerase protein